MMPNPLDRLDPLGEQGPLADPMDPKVREIRRKKLDEDAFLADRLRQTPPAKPSSPASSSPEVTKEILAKAFVEASKEANAWASSVEITDFDTSPSDQLTPQQKAAIAMQHQKFQEAQTRIIEEEMRKRKP